jgi:hypothetical protein
VAQLTSRTSTALAWLTARLGPYPYADTGAIVVSGGDTAMETATRATYSNDTPYDYEQATVVHELAHQWFGGRLTATNVADLWLHEAFATWLEREWMAEQPGGEPRADHIRRNYLSDGFQPDTSGQFGTVSVEAPTNAYRLESTVYYRGAAALEALHAQLGDTAFWQLLKDLASQPSGRTFTTDQVVALASQLSGTDLSGWRTTWLSSKDLQALPTPATPQQTADEISIGVAREAYTSGATTVTGQVLTDAVGAARQDNPSWVPYRSLTAGTTSYGSAEGVRVTRLNLEVPPGPLYGAEVLACLTLPTDISSNYGEVWYTDHAPLSTTFAADTITLAACPAQ